MSTVMIVEDDPGISDLVTLYLRNDGHTTEAYANGAEALHAFERPSPKPDVIVLDLMLPGLDGRGVARRIRANHQTPIIMLTALDDDRDKIEGFTLGADDYLTKPFNPLELVARVRALLRRSGSTPRPESPSQVRSLGNARVELNSRRVFVRGIELPLRTKEFELLVALSDHPGVAFTRERLLELVWSGEFFGDTRTVDVHISRLRERLASAESDSAIETVRSIGYRLRTPD